MISPHAPINEQHSRSFSLVIFSAISLLVLCALCTSCAVMGIFSQIAPVPEVQAAYKGLNAQTVGVMVWVDRSIRNDYPTLQMDIAKGITGQMVALSTPKNDKEKKKDEAKEFQFKELAYTQYRSAMEIIQYMENNPGLEGTASVDLAPKLGVSRVIYVQVFGFQTRPVESIDLYKGTLRARMEVLEVTGKSAADRQAKIVYVNPELVTVYPPRRPEGIAGEDVNGKVIFDKTVEAFTSDVVQVFIPHPAEK